MMKPWSRRNYSLITLAAGLLIVAFTIWLQALSSGPIFKWIGQIDNFFYDIQLQTNVSRLPPFKTNDIAIIAIDDQSLEKFGRWPWSRKVTTQLTQQLQAMGAAVIAFDITFPDPERDLSDVIQTMIATKTSQEVIDALHTLAPAFEYDTQFANVLKKSDVVLGFVLQKYRAAPQGILPPPLLMLNAEQAKVDFKTMLSYVGNLPELQQAAKHGGFINAIPDSDGVVREAPMIMRFKEGIYPSLALAATKLFLLSNNIELVFGQYGSALSVEGLKLDKVMIPTNAAGKILIPFRAGPYHFPYYSAQDILEKRINASAIQGKLLFVGITATALGDIHPTAIDNLYPGVEVHASIAAGILDNYIPHAPTWGRAVTFLTIIILGILFSALFPLFGPTALMLFLLGIPSLFWFLSIYLLITQHIVISFSLPIFMAIVIALLNIVKGYHTESKRRKEIKSLFGQYIPASRVEDLLKAGGKLNVQGESKEVTVLFSDIRDFTTLSEQLNAMELKNFLNQIFTPLTEVIFNHGGTIDKYVGDMVMAFWNAPAADQNHASHAVQASLDMQSEIPKINIEFAKKNLPAFDMGVGINTGIANIGDMGSKFRRAYTAIGDSINLGSRLEGLTKYYGVGIVVSETTYNLTKEEFLFRQLDRVKVKGKKEFVNVYQPLGKIGEVDDTLAQEVILFHQVLTHYFARHWQEAKSMLSQLIEKHPEVTLYRLYLERIAGLETANLDSSWDGAYIRDTK